MDGLDPEHRDNLDNLESMLTGREGYSSCLKVVWNLYDVSGLTDEAQFEMRDFLMSEIVVKALFVDIVTVKSRYADETGVDGSDNADVILGPRGNRVRG